MNHNIVYWFVLLAFCFIVFSMSDNSFITNCNLSDNCSLLNFSCGGRLKSTVSSPQFRDADNDYVIIYQSSNPSNLTNNSSKIISRMNFETWGCFDGCFANESTSRRVLCLPLDFLVLSVQNVTSTTISLCWKLLPSNLTESYAVYWAESVPSGSWTKSISLSSTSSGDTITDLKPNTGYEFYLEITLKTGEVIYYQEQPIVARTRIDAPVSPTNVRVDGGYLWWKAPPSEGSLDRDYTYTIEYRNRSSPDSPHVIYGEWLSDIQTIRNNTWIIDGIPYDQWYEFRVYASNEIGRGDSSLKTSPFKFSEPAQDSVPDNRLAIGLAVPLSIVAITLITFGSYKYRERRKFKNDVKKKLGLAKIELNYAGDSELDAIRHMTNLTAAAGTRIRLPWNYRDHLVLLSRDKLHLGNRLGSGAFGEVFSGTALIATNANEESEVSVAVKTLKQTASESERLAFLMESFVMSFFNHPNIISSIGVCLDNNPQYLVLELMEGGDLLNYIRKARDVEASRLKLSVSDLVDMSLDLVSGCDYLVSKNIIHRDLAARNCLVSTKSYDDAKRIVKIGDFGLARDLYEGDYYVQEGQTPMPVRWMAPESLAHQKYTFKSDVWSFGVLLWEIATFGTQPYSDIPDNVEVMNRVKEGMKLTRPHNCPQPLFDVMQSCWNDSPEERPCFENLRDALQHLKDQSQLLESDVISRSVIENGFANTHGHDNFSFISDDDAASILSSHSSGLKYITALENAKKLDETVPKQVVDVTRSVRPDSKVSVSNSAETVPKQHENPCYKTRNNYAKPPSRSSADRK